MFRPSPIAPRTSRKHSRAAVVGVFPHWEKANSPDGYVRCLKLSMGKRQKMSAAFLKRGKKGAGARVKKVPPARVSLTWMWGVGRLKKEGRFPSIELVRDEFQDEWQELECRNLRVHFFTNLSIAATTFPPIFLPFDI